mgnify:CR=1 FL=1
MAAAGILDEDDRVELLEGEIVQMSPIGDRHASMVNRLNALFMKALSDQWMVSVQNPIVLDDYNEPEPDISVVRAKPDFYKSGKPRPDDVVLIVEAADTSIRVDRKLKLPLYARYGIVEVWLLDIEADAVEVLREPSESRYKRVDRFGVGAAVSCGAFPEIEFRVDHLLNR